MFKLDGPIHKLLSRILDLIILNVIFTICCIPIVTIGASFSALYTVMFKIKEEKDSNVFKQFFIAFKDNFLQSLFGTLILLAVAALLYMDYNIVFVEKLYGDAIMKALFFIILFLVSGFFSWLFPMLSRFDNKFKEHLKNAFMLSLAHLPTTILVVILNLSPFILLYFFAEFSVYYLLTFWMFIGLSLIALVNSKLLYKAFSKYGDKEKENKEKNEE